MIPETRCYYCGRGAPPIVRPGQAPRCERCREMVRWLCSNPATVALCSGCSQWRRPGEVCAICTSSHNTSEKPVYT